MKLKTIRNWEEDQNEPRANKAQMLSGILGVPLIWLLSGEGDGVPEPSSDASIPASIEDILTEMRSLKTEMAQSARKLSRLEKRLRNAV